MKTNRALAFVFVSVTAFEGLFCPGLTMAADPAAVIDKNEFKNEAETEQTDFHLTITGKFTEPPKAKEFNEVRGGDGKPLKGNNSADFEGGAVGPGKTVTVSFKSETAQNAPTGFFTPSGGVVVPSISFRDKKVTFVPSGGDQFVCSLDLDNADFGSLTGDLAVYVNSGISHFNLEEFDTLFNAVSVFSLPDYSFNMNEGVNDITASLSVDQFVLVVGTADTGDGSGAHAFALAFAPPGSLNVPEISSTLLLESISVLGLFMFGWRGWRLAAPTNA